MKKILIGIVLVFLASGAFSQGIEFYKGDFNAALKQAEKEGKILFIDFYTSWCGPCKKMAKEVFTLKEVGDYFNANFISTKVQCDKDDISKAIGEKYKVKGYPTLMWLKPDGSILHTVLGAKDKDTFLQEAKNAVRKMD